MSVPSLNPLPLHLYLKMFLWFQMLHLPPLLLSLVLHSIFALPMLAEMLQKVDTRFRVLKSLFSVCQTKLSILVLVSFEL